MLIVNDFGLSPLKKYVDQTYLNSSVGPTWMSREC